MKKIFLSLSALSLLLPNLARAGDIIWTQPNNSANYVRLENIKDSKATEMGITHPYTFTQDQIEDMLRSIRYSRRAMFGDGEKIRSVFEWEYIKKYAPKIVEAFSKAKPNQEISMSVAQKRPLVILRNDRLTQVRMWVTNNKELVLYFDKTEAKLEGDYQSKGQAGQALMNNSKGLRIELEPQTGQKFGLDTTDELILDLSTNWGQVADAIDAEDARLEEESKAKKSKATEKLAKSKTSSATDSAPAPVAPLSEKDQKTSEQRLEELKKLKDKGLINDQDYNKKKNEILQGI